MENAVTEICNMQWQCTHYTIKQNRLRKSSDRVLTFDNTLHLGLYLIQPWYKDFEEEDDDVEEEFI